MSSMLYLESLAFSCLLNKEVSGWLFERESLTLCYFWGGDGISQLHPEMGKLNRSQCYDELFGDPICNVDALPETGQMFFSFLTWHKNQLKSLRS